MSNCIKKLFSYLKLDMKQITIGDKRLGPSAPKSRKGNVRRKCGGSRSYLKSKI